MNTAGCGCAGDGCRRSHDERAGDAPKHVEALNSPAKPDPVVVITHAESGEHIVAGAGELQLESCVKHLRDDFLKGKILPASETHRELARERERGGEREPDRLRGVCV